MGTISFQLNMVCIGGGEGLGQIAPPPEKTTLKKPSLITAKTRGVFLGISKAFDKVWHAEIIYKVKPVGVPVDLLKLVNNFLKKRS